MLIHGTWLKSYYRMKSFSDLGIKHEGQLDGRKIGIDDVVGKEVTVTDYRIDRSKFPQLGNGQRLTLQIELDGVNRVIFTGSTILQDQITQVNKDDFPFKATIVRLQPRGYKLT